MIFINVFSYNPHFSICPFRCDYDFHINNMFLSSTINRQEPPNFMQVLCKNKPAKLITLRVKCEQKHNEYLKRFLFTMKYVHFQFNSTKKKVSGRPKNQFLNKFASHIFGLMIFTKFRNRHIAKHTYTHIHTVSG